MSNQQKNTRDFVWIHDLPDWDGDTPDGYVTGTASRTQNRSTARSSSASAKRTKSKEGKRRSSSAPSGKRSSGTAAASRSGRGSASAGHGTGKRPQNRADVIRKNNKRAKRRGPSMIYKIIALVFIVVIILIAGFFIRNFGGGTKAANHGMEAFANGYYDQAVRDFKEAVSYDRDNANYVNMLGMAQIQNSDFDGALETFNQLLASSRKSADKQLAYRGIGMAQLYKNNYSDAVLALNQAATYVSKELSETDKDVLYYLAEAQMKSGDPVGAVLSYTTILEQEENVTAYMLRGVAYEQVGDNTNAEADLNKVIELAGENFKIYMTLYQVLLDEGKEDDAAKILKKASELPVVTAEDYSNRGYIYTCLEENELARADFDKAIEMSYFQAYFGKAVLLMNEHNYEEAEKCFIIYFDQFKDNAKAYNQYGICLMALGKYNEAVEAFQHGINANDRALTQELLFNIVVAYERTGAWNKAEAEINEYIEKYPDDAKATRELRFIRSRQYTTEADAANHPEIEDIGEVEHAVLPVETEETEATETEIEETEATESSETEDTSEE